MQKASFKAAFDKFKTDKKTRNTVIGASAGALVVIAAAIIIPVSMHNSVPIEPETLQAAVSDSAATTDAVSAAGTTAPETTTGESTTQEESTVPSTAEAQSTTEKSTSKNSGSSASGSSNSGSSSGKSNSGSSGKSGNSGSSGSSSSNKGQTTTTTEQPKVESYDWSQAEVDAIVAEARAYGESLGLVWVDSLTPETTSWNQPGNSWFGKQGIRDGLKSEVYHLKEIADREGITGGGFKVLAKRYYEPAAAQEAGQNGYCWEFYVMR